MPNTNIDSLPKYAFDLLTGPVGAVPNPASYALVELTSDFVRAYNDARIRYASLAHIYGRRATMELRIAAPPIIFLDDTDQRYADDPSLLVDGDYQCLGFGRKSVMRVNGLLVRRIAVSADTVRGLGPVPANRIPGWPNDYPEIVNLRFNDERCSLSFDVMGAGSALELNCFCNHVGYAIDAGVFVSAETPYTAEELKALNADMDARRTRATSILVKNNG
jgi:hypothetical protein